MTNSERADRTIAEWCAEVKQFAIQKGWWDDGRPDDSWYMLLVTEAAEAYEEFRKGFKPHEVYEVDEKPEGIGIELADILIRVFHMAAHYNLDLEALLERKLEYNKTRPHRHGGKVR